MRRYDIRAIIAAPGPAPIHGWSTGCGQRAGYRRDGGQATDRTSLPLPASNRSDKVADSRPRDGVTPSVHRQIRDQAAPGAGTTVEAVKFISGDDSLKGFVEPLRTAKYDVTFPDNSPTKILRRGVLGCSTTTGDCSFVLMLPDDVRSAD